MKAHHLRSNSRRPAFFNISVQKKKFPTQGPEIRNSNNAFANGEMALPENG